MEITFDSAKNDRNIRERGLSFERVAEVDFNAALMYPDPRKEYSETRYIALCYLEADCMCCVLPRPRRGYGLSASAKRTQEGRKDMASRKPLIDADGEVRELTAEDMAKFRPAAETLPPSLIKKLGVRGRPKATVTKERITIRLSRGVVETFRATGEGWQTRMDEVLQEYVREHRLG